MNLLSCLNFVIAYQAIFYRVPTRELPNVTVRYSLTYHST